MIVAVVLCLMALCDGALSGFRAAAGRNALVRKQQYYVRAAAHGLVAALAALAVLGATIGLTLGVAEDPAGRYEGFVAAGGRMLVVYLPYSVLVLGALAGLAIPRFEVRSVLTTLILGPSTLLRPLIIMAGAVLAGVGARDPVVASLAWLAALVVLAIEFVVARRHYPDLDLPPVGRGTTDTIGR